MIRAKVKSWNFVLLQSIDNILTSMILCIIQNKQSILSPVMIFSIQMIHQLTKKESESKAIGSTKITRIENFIVVADSSYDVKLVKSLAVSDLVLNTF